MPASTRHCSAVRPRAEIGELVPLRNLHSEILRRDALLGKLANQVCAKRGISNLLGNDIDADKLIGVLEAELLEIVEDLFDELIGNSLDETVFFGK